VPISHFQFHSVGLHSPVIFSSFIFHIFFCLLSSSLNLNPPSERPVIKLIKIFQFSALQASLYWPQTDDSKKRVSVTDDGQVKLDTEWLLETEGSNLMQVLSDPEVDARRTTTNHITEIFAVSENFPA
jgi:hypothetical protein